MAGGSIASSCGSRNHLHHSCLSAAITLGLVAAAVLLASLASAVPASAKGPIGKITVVGHGLTGPIEITDAKSLAPFEPWPAGLIAWGRGRIAKPPPVEETYEVSFYLVGGGMIYALRYSTDPSGAPGYIYVPGRGDPEFSRNIGRIGTGDGDFRNRTGEWYHATLDWGTLMQQALDNAGNAPYFTAGRRRGVSHEGLGACTGSRGAARRSRGIAAASSATETGGVSGVVWAAILYYPVT